VSSYPTLFSNPNMSIVVLSYYFILDIVQSVRQIATKIHLAFGVRISS